MKKIIYILLFMLNFININAQTTTVDLNNGSFYTSAYGTYIKDTNNQFGPFLGTWKYQLGNEVLIIKLEKVTKYYHDQYGTYEDFIKGNYSYSTDNGTTFVVNTIQQNLNINAPKVNAMYSCGPVQPNLNEFRFTDVVYNKNAHATFKFQNNNFNQLHLKLDNISRGYIAPALPPNPAFCIPNNVILIKQ